MNKFYTINELKDIENSTSVIQFFNLPSKISKIKYEKHFKQKYDEFFIKDLSITQMRRYYRDDVYRFYIDNIEEIKTNNDLFLDYIESLDVNIRKSLTSVTIKSTYSEVLDSFLHRLNKELIFEDNIEYYMSGFVKGSSYKNKDDISKKILEYLGDKAKIDFKNCVKLSYIIRKYYFGEDLRYYCVTCGNIIEASKENKECKSCYLEYKQERANSKREVTILSNVPEHINFINGDFNTTDFYNEEYTIFCKKCNKESNFIFKSKRRILKCPNCDEKYTITHRINEDFYNIFKLNDRKFITPLEIDMINYEHKLCIEYNGLMFHSHGASPYAKFNNLNIDEYYHLRKTERVQEKGFKLLHIFENEWLNKNKREVWKSIIKEKMNLHEKIKIDGSIIKNIDKEEIKDFLIYNSLDKYIESDINLGLYHNEDLYSVVSFNRIKDKEYKITNLANKINYNIDYSVLISYFEEEYNPYSIEYLSNRRYLNDSIEVYGFKFIENTDPRCFKFRVNENILEECEFDELLFKQEYRVIYDCGYTVFRKHY